MRATLPMPRPLASSCRARAICLGSAPPHGLATKHPYLGRVPYGPASRRPTGNRQNLRSTVRSVALPLGYFRDLGSSMAAFALLRCEFVHHLTRQRPSALICSFLQSRHRGLGILDRKLQLAAGKLPSQSPIGEQACSIGVPVGRLWHPNPVPVGTLDEVSEAGCAILRRIAYIGIGGSWLGLTDQREGNFIDRAGATSQTHECGDSTHTNAETIPDHLSMIPARSMGLGTISADDGPISGRVAILPHVKCNAAIRCSSRNCGGLRSATFNT